MKNVQISENSVHNGEKTYKISSIGIILTYVEQGQEITPAPNNR